MGVLGKPSRDNTCGFVTTTAYEKLQAENAKLRELVADMWHDGMCDCDEHGACAKCEYGYLDRMRELGIEVDG